MESLDRIQRSIDYIEENLKSEISAQELAEQANFSVFHYYRLFQMAVGMPVMQYITRRKLHHAMYEIGCGRKIMEVALDYGFDTYAGFYKACKREFGYSPKQFLKNNKVNKPYRIHLFQEGHRMVTHKKVKEILTNWNLQNEIIRDVFYESGERNEHVWYVGESYSIKAFANLGTLKNALHISKSLEKLGVSAPTPIKTAEGRELVEDGQFYFVLTKRLHGARIKAAAAYEGEYKDKARFIGEIIGQLSLALAKVDAVVKDVNLYHDVKNWAYPKVKDMLHIPERFWQDAMESFGRLYSTLPKQIIHRDPNPSNMILAEDTWGFIDFDLSERNIRIFDPCYAATAILSESFDENKPEKLAQWIGIYKNIMYGYDSVAKLSANEIKAFPYVLLFNQLICCAWLSEQEKYTNIFQVNKKMTTWICVNFDALMLE